MAKNHTKTRMKLWQKNKPILLTDPTKNIRKHRKMKNYDKIREKKKKKTNTKYS